LPSAKENTTISAISTEQHSPSPLCRWGIYPSSTPTGSPQLFAASFLASTAVSTENTINSFNGFGRQEEQQQQNWNEGIVVNKMNLQQQQQQLPDTIINFGNTGRQPVYGMHQGIITNLSFRMFSFRKNKLKLFSGTIYISIPEKLTKENTTNLLPEKSHVFFL